MSNIGLIIWGTKGGYRMLGSHNVDINSDIVHTIKDARDFVRFNKAKVDYFTLEFTHAYKVCTIFRSAFEVSGSTGAYIAITLYVPHDEKVYHIYELLYRMMNTYFSRYVDEISMCIKGEKENMELFVNMINRAKWEQGVSRALNISAQNNHPSVVKYQTPEELNKWLSSPYSKQFIKEQKVAFFAEDIINDLDKFGCVFTLPPQYLERSEIGEEEQSFSFKPIPSHLNISVNSFYKGDKDITTTYFIEEFYESDIIRIELSKSFYSNVSRSNITIKQALEERIFLLNDNKLALNDRIGFNSLNYEIKFINTGNWKNSSDFKLFLRQGSYQKFNAVDDKFLLTSEQMGKNYDVVLQQQNQEPLIIKNSERIEPLKSIFIHVDILKYKINSGLENNTFFFLKNGKKTTRFFRNTSEIYEYVSIHESKPEIQIENKKIEFKEEKIGELIYLSKVVREVPRTNEYQNFIKTDLNKTTQYTINLRYEEQRFNNDRFKLNFDSVFSGISNVENTITIPNATYLSAKSFIDNNAITIVDENREFDDYKFSLNKDEKFIFVNLMKKGSKNAKLFKKILLYVIIPLLILVGGYFVLKSFKIPPFNKNKTEIESAEDAQAVAVSKEKTSSTINKNLQNTINNAWSKLDSMSCSKKDVENMEMLLQDNPNIKIMKDGKSFDKNFIKTRVDLYKEFFTRAKRVERDKDKGLGIDYLKTLYFPSNSGGIVSVGSSYFSTEQKNLLKKIAETNGDAHWNYIGHLDSYSIINPTFQDIADAYK